MSEPTTTPTESPVIVRIIADHARAIDALASSPADSLDAVTLRANYEGAVNLARALNTSENLTNRFAALTAENDDLSLERDAAVADRNALTARVSQLEAQLTQTLALANAAASLPVSRRSQPDPKPFTGEDRTLLQPFLLTLRLRLQDRPGEFPDEQSKLRYAMLRLEGPALKQVMHLVRPDRINLATFEDFASTLEEAYGDPDRVSTAERGLAKLRQGNRDFVTYHAEFQRLVADVDWNDAAKRAAFHRGLCDELKDILSTQDIPEDWHEYVALVKKRDSQFRARKAELHRHTVPTKSVPTPAAHSTPSTPAQNTPHPTSSGSGHLGPAPMDLSAARRRLSPEERQKRIDENRCLYCGGFNHLARDCPNKPKNPTRPIRGAVAELVAPEELSETAESAQSGNV
jgi:hypothetical protein